MPAPLVNKVLIVCTANICRSPAAEILFRHRVGAAVQVQSAGTHALVGSQIDFEMANRVKTLVGNSIAADIAAHRARQLDESLARWAELILVMTREHHAWCLNSFPFLAGRVHYFATEQASPPQSTPAAGVVPRNPKPVDVEDPYQLSDVIYNATFERVRDGVERWVGKIL